jgi:hypothetical protein
MMETQRTRALSREEMETVIREGGSIMLPGGRIVADIGSLPTKTQLAQGDIGEMKKVSNDLDREISRLIAERAQIQKQMQETGAEAEEEEPPRKSVTVYHQDGSVTTPFVAGDEEEKPPTEAAPKGTEPKGTEPKGPGTDETRQSAAAGGTVSQAAEKGPAAPGATHGPTNPSGPGQRSQPSSSESKK